MKNPISALAQGMIVVKWVKWDECCDGAEWHRRVDMGETEGIFNSSSAGSGWENHSFQTAVSGQLDLYRLATAAATVVAGGLVSENGSSTSAE